MRGALTLSPAKPDFGGFGVVPDGTTSEGTYGGGFSAAPAFAQSVTAATAVPAAVTRTRRVVHTDHILPARPAHAKGPCPAGRPNPLSPAEVLALPAPRRSRPPSAE